jgi:colanic acid biosynthesis glycosyl transferase WcaI
MSAKRSTLWILTEVYYPEEISTGYYLTTIAEGLATSENVHVLTGQPKHMARGTRALRREERNGVNITRVWGTTLDKNVLIFRLINMLTIGVSMFIRSALSFRRGDKVLVVTAPPSLPFTTTVAAMMRGATVTVLVQDSYPEILVAVGAASERSPLVRLAHFANRLVYKYASAVIVMGRDMRELFLRKTEGLDVPVVVIPNWADLKTVIPQEKDGNKLLKDLGLEGKFVLLYAGNMGPPTDVETILSAAGLLAGDETLHFLFIGAGAKKTWIQREVQRLSLRNVTVLDHAAWKEQSNFLNAADVGLVSLISGMKGTAMPSRTYNLMAAGKPVIAICDEGSELDLVVQEENIGITLRPGDVNGLVDAIGSMKTREDERARMSQRARSAAERKYSPEMALEAYRSVVSIG